MAKAGTLRLSLVALCNVGPDADAEALWSGRMR
jgi:hypothetical protein